MKVLFILCLVLLLGTTFDEVSIAYHPSSDPIEEYDVVISHGRDKLGLVRMRVSDKGYCVVVSDLKQILGYTKTDTTNECLSLDEIFAKYGIPLSYSKATVELKLEIGFNYPAKDYLMALARSSRVQNSTINPIVAMFNYSHSTVPDVKRIDMTMTNAGHPFSTPDLRIAIAGDAAGGSARLTATSFKYGQAEPYKIQDVDYGWTWRPSNRNNLLSHIDIGSKIGDMDWRNVINGVSLTNKPMASRDFGYRNILNMQAPVGSIIEWDRQLGDRNSIMVGETGEFHIDANLRYGLNKFNYLITNPGEVSKEETHWIRVPVGMVPKGRLEYRAVLGKLSQANKTNLNQIQFDYGLGHRVSIGAFQTSFIHYTLEHFKYGASFILSPFYTSEIRASANSDNEYSIHASLWKPGVVSIDVSDFKTEPSRFSLGQFSRRYSMIRTTFENSRHLRNQIYYIRSEIHSNVYSRVSSTSMYYSDRWTIAANIGQQWSRNYGTPTQGQINVHSSVTHRFKSRLMVASEISGIKSKRSYFEFIRLSSYYNTSSMQIGGILTHHFTNNASSVGLTARVFTDWLTASSRQEIIGSNLYGFQSMSTTWMKSGAMEWQPMPYGSIRSSGIIVIPFHDKNGNGVKERTEPELSGLIGEIREGRVINPSKSPEKLMFADLQGYRSYTIKLNSELRDHPSYMVQQSQISVDTPGNGFRVIYVPVVEAYEVSGSWKTTNDTVIHPGRTKLILSKLDGGTIVQGTLFSDGTWLVDKIGSGTYSLAAISSNGDILAVTPTLLQVDHRLPLMAVNFIISKST